MDEFYEGEFWEMVYQEYGVVDELDILSENVLEIIQPQPGLLILITKEFYNGKES
tara:strand:+ start:433 stop:597 length:165 start_codon:yes stop_codon:yes gene_type:complete